MGDHVLSSGDLAKFFEFVADFEAKLASRASDNKSGPVGISLMEGCEVKGPAGVRSPFYIEDPGVMCASRQTENVARALTERTWRRILEACVEAAAKLRSPKGYSSWLRSLSPQSPSPTITPERAPSPNNSPTLSARVPPMPKRAPSPNNSPPHSARVPPMPMDPPALVLTSMPGPPPPFAIAGRPPTTSATPSTSVFSDFESKRRRVDITDYNVPLDNSVQPALDHVQALASRDQSHTVQRYPFMAKQVLPSSLRPQAKAVLRQQVRDMGAAKRHDNI